ncbi:hypothetical protein AtubIFM54640_008978 [Aspergillus tubingensis]|nr:hypothetical protein AtubIFM54640_008978 [Aspergillus tubingensis]
MAIWAEPGLSGIRLDTNIAPQMLSNFCNIQSSSSKSSTTALGLQGEMENIRIEGDRTAPRNTVKVIVERDQNVKLLRERSGSLQALPRVKLQREKLFPIRMDAVRKTGMFDDLGEEERHLGKSRVNGGLSGEGRP